MVGNSNSNNSESHTIQTKKQNKKKAATEHILTVPRDERISRIRCWEGGRKEGDEGSLQFKHILVEGMRRK